jgi:exopolyphosphatase / guanosine-5'-triphosphate,3'-diphosphate pyrophosphatase
MSAVRRAVIDVGTNSVKLLVADIAASDVFPIWEDSKQTRLGSGFYETHVLQREPIDKTAAAVAKFAQEARRQNAVSTRVIATSAARDAINAAELVSAIESVSGLKVEIISGEQEAEWAFHGVTTNSRLRDQTLLLLDVGGGSTEFILGRGEHKHFRESFPLGTVRLMEKIPPSDPPTPAELEASWEWIKTFLVEQVRPKLAPAIQLERATNIGTVHLIGTGGTTSILGRMEAQLEDYDRDLIEATRLTIDRVKWHRERLWNLPLAERRKIIGLPPKRADVILTGVLIFEAVMEEFGFPELLISTRGLRFAAVMEPLR